ncbi:RNA polymerase sigma factor [Roseivirga echinicomitans]|uniref:RNA polymerase sigma factor n=1 Tax=Roseivirga echinicomitans TaxID=296218 RepID=A0A150X9S1_9BACT|nr:RNA polymerase sigma factor [Roseivirga echinicomitans]KYG75471.1 RNA polymerase subunit sigma [Roseivirga echinicomitans]
MDDHQIVEGFKNPTTKNKAFSVLLDKYQQRIYWHVRKIIIDHDDTDDVVQDVFIKVFKNLDGFREASQLYTWIYRIATNEALTFLKKRQRKQAWSIDDISHDLENKLTSGSYIDGDEIQVKLQKAILTLPEKQKLVFNMKYFDDLKYEEISEIIGTSVGGLKANYHLAVKKIEEYLSED